MKKVFIILPLILFCGSLFASNLTALFSYCSFNVPESSPYVEVYLNVVGATVKFVPVENNMKKGQIEVQWVIKEGDRIVHFDKYNLNSPLIPVDDSLIPAFIDQQRIKLNSGSYKLELSIKDKNTDNNPITLHQDINVAFPADSVSLSDIELIESYTKTTVQSKLTKSGYDIVPAVNSFYPRDITSLKFYTEVYQTNKVPADEYLIRYFISRFDNNKTLSSYSFNLRQKPAPTNVVLGDIPIENLQSGNYNLNIEVRNRMNQLLAFKQMMFQRSNPQTKTQVTTDMTSMDIEHTFVSQIGEMDSLVELINCLHPISSNVEIDVGDLMMEQRDATSMQKFLYYFWAKRNPENPEEGFQKYMLEVEKVNRMYSAMRQKGYMTDRGRVYLQYGPPNTTTAELNDPSAYPYEIWHYYKLNNQTNRKFIFYSKEISTNDFRLLHSDAIGELQQPQWQAMLHERSVTHQTKSGAIGIDQTESDDIYGSHSKENFSNPH